MNIPKSYEALAADLASEKILSKTLIGQKEAYMMLADQLKLDLATWKQKACEAAEREAALREELDKAVWELVDARDVSLKFEESLKAICQPIIEDSRSTLIIKDRLDILAGHMGENGDEGYSIVMGATHEISRLVKFNSELQQRLTVAEQRVDLLEGLLKSGSSPTYAHCSAVMEALKPAEEGEGP